MTAQHEVPLSGTECRVQSEVYRQSPGTAPFRNTLVGARKQVEKLTSRGAASFVGIQKTRQGTTSVRS